MKAIVTGADGFVGSHVVSRLLSLGYDVFAVDVCETPRRLNVQDQHLRYFRHSADDLSFLSKFAEGNGYDVLFYFAWMGSAGVDRGNESIQIKNLIDSCKCLRSAHSVGVKRFVFASSIAEFETEAVTYMDESKPDSHYIYGASKGAAHEFLKPIASSLGIDLIWTYITNCYGPGDTSNRFLNSALRKIIKCEPLEFTSGTQNYDFVYIDDVSEAFVKIGEKGLSGKSYLIGSGEAQPLRNFMETMLKALKPTSKVIFGSIPFTGVQLPVEKLSIEKLSIDCGFRPKTSFSNGVVKTFDWLKENDHV
jgi:UDP-glucose 4-epimerase